MPKDSSVRTVRYSTFGHGDGAGTISPMTDPQKPFPPSDDSGRPAASDEKMYTSEPIEADDGETYVIRQQNVGPGNELGGGEWPDPHTPPSSEPTGEAVNHRR
jgi:hypothetical protein